MGGTLTDGVERGSSLFLFKLSASSSDGILYDVYEWALLAFFTNHFMPKEMGGGMCMHDMTYDLYSPILYTVYCTQITTFCISLPMMVTERWKQCYKQSTRRTLNAKIITTTNSGFVLFAIHASLPSALLPRQQRLACSQDCGIINDNLCA